MAAFKQIWSPTAHGLSVSGLELWLVDRTAFELSYLRNLEAVEPWNKNIHYGTFVQAGIEGYIKTRNLAGVKKFIEVETGKQLVAYDDWDDILWWAEMARQTVHQYVEVYAKDLDKYEVRASERHHQIELTLPSGRMIKLHGYIDGEGDDVLVENKCRGEYDEQAIAREIDLNLQVNMYCLFYRATSGRLPSRVWYQNIRRPAGFGFKGPRQKQRESREGFRDRIVQHMRENRPYYFYRWWMRPNEKRFGRFMNQMMFPMLEAFLDWYEYMVSPQKSSTVNRVHWTTPYGLYNPFMEGTQERFRQYRIDGSLDGLRPKVSYRDARETAPKAVKPATATVNPSETSTAGKRKRIR